MKCNAIANYEPWGLTTRTVETAKTLWKREVASACAKLVSRIVVIAMLIILAIPAFATDIVLSIPYAIHLLFCQRSAPRTVFTDEDRYQFQDQLWTAAEKNDLTAAKKLLSHPEIERLFPNNRTIVDAALRYQKGAVHYRYISIEDGTLPPRGIDLLICLEATFPAIPGKYEDVLIRLPEYRRRKLGYADIYI
ncbi:MAG TPA: hypothetical protein VLE89_04375 [Chlamydiales bacterium]|nr:hypothetical protein [Chlamydiales bacterium]